MNKRTTKKYFRSFASLLFFLAIALFYQGWNAGALLGFSDLWKVVEGVPKAEVVQDDDDILVGAGRKANVLFLLDTGSQMTFTPIGTMPEWNVNVTTRVSADAYLAQSTYGHGGLNVVGTTASGRERYGRDLDATNNVTTADVGKTVTQFMADHINDYYFPFNNTTHPLGTNATGTTALKPGSAGIPQPLALVFRNTNYWNVSTIPSSYGALMPNDSRMYKMKLVMWRLLDDSTLFERLRVGMATTFQEFNVRTSNYIADFYKASPFGALYTYGGYTFQNGTGPDWATSIPGSGGYGNSQACYWGIDRNYYDGYGHTTSTWRLINRAYLRVPISDYTTDHANLFRVWIDGYEDVSNGGASDPYFFKNPELIADGKTFLSTAIYPGHPDLSRSTLLNQSDGAGRAKIGIAFSHRTPGTNYANNVTTGVNPGTTGTCMNVLKAGGTGEALGTVLDFFSPPVNGIGGAPGSAYNVFNAPEVSFPIKDNCESNWLIIFTAGDDSSGYSTADAVLSLFKETKNKKVTRRTGQSGNNNTFEEVQLDDGVRTIVVGFVDPNDPAKNVDDLRTKLNNIARAGDPMWNGSDWVADPSKHAYFANDVPGLMEVLREILVHINAEIRPAKGPMTESSSLETGTLAGDFDLFSASYKVNNEDQWQGELVRYQSHIATSGDISVTLPAKWELGTTLLNLRTKGSGGRNLVYWSSSGWSDLKYTTGDNEYPDADVGILLGLQTADLKTPSRYTGKLHPSRAMINWLHGYDFNYADNKEVERKFLLSDFGQSGVAMVQPPAKDALSLPGYDTWADSALIKSRDIRLFAQSNEGILHVINPTATGAGLETMAIVPPPVMQPFRLAATKFAVSTVGLDKKVEWDDNTTSGDAGYASRPAYLLDGPLFLRDFDLDLNGTSWGTYLIGMLGRAGNGLYLMNVTQPQNPKFLWFRETRYRSDGRPVLIRRGASDAEPTYAQDTGTDMSATGPVFNNPDAYPFFQMGYNMPRPVAGVAKLPDNSLRNMIVLAGGMQENLDLNNNGYVGAALYIVDPKDGSAVKVFNSGSLSGVSADCRAGTMKAGPDPYMGMLVTPPAILRSGTTKSIAGKVFTADNRGNIFMVNLERGFGTSADSLPQNDWSIQTVGTLRAKSLESNADDNHCIPLGILVSTVSSTGATWVSGGTSNIGTRNNDSPTNNSAMIRNKGQYIFSFKVSEDKALYRDDLVGITVVSGDKAPDGANGWYIKLQAESATSNDEYVTTRPVLMAGKIYCTTFIPTKSSATCNSAVDGTSRIYAVSLETGEEKWGSKVSGKYIEIRGIKFAGLTHSTKGSKETIIGSYAVTNKATSEEDLNKLVALGLISRANGVPMITFGEGEGTDPPFPPLSTYINYWREVF